MAMEAAAPVCTFDVGQTSKGNAAVAHVVGQSTEVVMAVGLVMSSTMRTPWPRRSALQNCTASQIEGSPKASPAWMVRWKSSR